MTATGAAIGLPTRARSPERLAPTGQAPTSASTPTARAVIPDSVGAAPPNSAIDHRCQDHRQRLPGQPAARSAGQMRNHPLPAPNDPRPRVVARDGRQHAADRPAPRTPGRRSGPATASGRRGRMRHHGAQDQATGVMAGRRRSGRSQDRERAWAGDSGGTIMTLQFVRATGWRECAAASGILLRSLLLSLAIALAGTGIAQAQGSKQPLPLAADEGSAVPRRAGRPVPARRYVAVPPGYHRRRDRHNAGESPDRRHPAMEHLLC